MVQSFEEYLIQKRYSVRDGKGNSLERTYDDVIERVCRWCDGSGEGLDKNILDDLRGHLIVPASPILMNAGSPYHKGTHFSCFPLGYVGDSMDQIMAMAMLLASIFKGGGGAGIDLSHLREKHAAVSNNQGQASGPTSFLEIYETVARVVSQGGRRRGALMCTLDADHPDVEEFIKLKTQDENFLRAVNLSVRIKSKTQLDRYGPLIAEAIHACGDPGVLFLENQLRVTTVDPQYEPIHVNPCAEYMAPAMTACNLVALNLHALAGSSSNFNQFLTKVGVTARRATIFANHVLDHGVYPNTRIKRVTQQFRPVGVGFTGLHTALHRFSFSYVDDTAVQKIQAALLAGTLDASTALTLTHGYSPVRKVIHVGHTLELIQRLREVGYHEICDQAMLVVERHGGLFNSTTTTQAPTGSVSMLVNCPTTGIEPAFARVMKKGYVDDQNEWREVEIDTGIDETAEDINWMDQLNVVSTVQRLCHTSVSKTVNIPNKTTVEEIVNILDTAYAMGLKAVSIYRDGSKQTQALTRVKDDTEPKIIVREVERVPDTFNTQCYVVAGPTTCRVFVDRRDDGTVRQVFISTGKAGSALTAMAEALGRVISIGLRKDISIGEAYAHTLAGIDAGVVYTVNGRRYHSIPDVVSAIISGAIEGRETALNTATATGNLQLCLNCGKMAVLRSGGCLTCTFCGHSTC